MAKRKLPKNLPMKERLMQYTQGLLRVEVRLHSMELKRRGLERATAWYDQNLPFEIVKERIKMMKINQTFKLTEQQQAELPPRLTAVYRLWKSGEDIRNIYTRSTFYRYRSDLIPYGIDISTPAPSSPGAVPLIRYLQADHLSVVPDDFRNSILFFDSRKAA